ncbi:MAG: PIN domain-containing protein [Deltaproteobacteria bacterium]|nr:PIN domain-containing protein [Deltaproteobacteria bacterium]
MKDAVTLDAGALIAFERGDRAAVTRIARAVELRVPLVVPAGVVAQVWRDGRRQSRLARLLATAVQIEELNDERARAAGQLCGATRTTDVIDASVALCARARGGKVMTSDAADLRRLDPTLDCIEV